MEKAIQPSQTPTDEIARLEQEFADAREQLRLAEEKLAREQAAVNRFRLQCRLKIGLLVDDVLEARTIKQRLLTRLEMLHQAADLGIDYEDEEPFWQAEEEPFDADTFLDGLPIPTDAPRDRAAEKRLYRELARRFHPDLAGGSAERAYRTTMMAAINTAYKADDIGTLRDLAGELDPGMIVELNVHDTQEVRRLRRRILSCRRRVRRAMQEYRALNQENTARLYRRATQLEAEGRNWLAEVRGELQAELERLNGEVARLETEITALDAKVGATES